MFVLLLFLHICLTTFDEIIVVTRIWIGHDVYINQRKSDSNELSSMIYILLSCNLGKWKRFENEIFWVNR
jgi:hypothetical protein